MKYHLLWRATKAIALISSTVILLTSLSASAAPPLKDGQYLIRTTWNNRTQCLIFSNNGNERHPSRHNWGTASQDKYCGHPDGIDGFVKGASSRAQSVFTFTNLDGANLYMITTRWNNRTQCLIFSNNGNERHPSRHNWGTASQDKYCGHPDGKNGFRNTSQQGVWRVKPLGGGEFLLQSRWNNRTECLIFSNNGNENNPSRHNWGQGPDEYCGFPGGRDGIISTERYTYRFLSEVNRYEIGDTGPGGGIVFFTKDGGKHGLEAAKKDLGDGERYSWSWGGDDRCHVPGEGTHWKCLFCGKYNTAQIIKHCGEDTAAYLTTQVGPGWYLPTLGELDALAKSMTTKFRKGNPDQYWSSAGGDSKDPLRAWMQAWGALNPDNPAFGWYLSPKHHKKKVWPVRAF